MKYEQNKQSKKYTGSDMARLSAGSCAGCGACCRGMGDTIVLDLYDVCLLTAGLGLPFADLLEKAVDLHVEDGIILPHLRQEDCGESIRAAGRESGSPLRTGKESGSPLRTSKESGDSSGTRCHFLGENGRCRVHAFRPGICRLFPLGRQYGEGKEGKITYFLLEDACIDRGRTKVRIDKWLGIPDLPRYEAFKMKWHRLLRTLEARLAAENDPDVAGKVNLFFLQTFFMKPYFDLGSGGQPNKLNTKTAARAETGLPLFDSRVFYEQLEERIKQFSVVL